MTPHRRAMVCLFMAFSLMGCRTHVTKVQCDELLARFASLVVKEKMPTASPEAVNAEQAREREESAHDDNLFFKNCTSELRVEEYRCAMVAESSDALLKCLE